MEGGGIADRGIYKVQTVARLVGVTPAVLRTWESRYDFLAPERTQRGHRLYTQQDLQVLRSIKRLLDEGLNIGEIAQIGRTQLLSKGAVSSEGGARPASRLPNVLQGWVQRAWDCALRADSDGLLEELNWALQTWTPELVISEALVQFTALAKAQSADNAPFAKLAERLFVFRLGTLYLGANPLGVHCPRALCLAFPGDQEELPAISAAYLLARHGWRVSYLGVSATFADVEAAARRLAPEIIYVSVSRSLLYLVHSEALAKLSFCVARPHQLWVGGEGIERKDEASFTQMPGPLHLNAFREQVALFQGMQVPR